MKYPDLYDFRDQFNQASDFIRVVTDEPPEPTFWMHQLPAAAGADGKSLLNPGKFSSDQSFHFIPMNTPQQSCEEFF